PLSTASFGLLFSLFLILFLFQITATPEIYTLSLHDALPISTGCPGQLPGRVLGSTPTTVIITTKKTSQVIITVVGVEPSTRPGRSEEHTSELQSQSNLVCRLLLEKKKKKKKKNNT